MQRVREVERKKQFDEYKDRVGEIINGVVKRTEYGNLMVDLGRAEALLRRDETIPREAFRNEPLTDFAIEANRRAMQDAIDRARGRFDAGPPLVVPMVIDGKSSVSRVEGTSPCACVRRNCVLPCCIKDSQR